MILFLDFDGVLHPDAVFLSRNGPVLRSDGRLFMWADLLEDALQDFPAVKIVLSTSWVRHLGFSKAKKRLPLGLQGRIIGSTWHSSMEKQMSEQIWWDSATRHAQITRFLARSRPTTWIALDDDAVGWGAEHAERLVLTDAATGISDPSTFTRLKELLKGAGK